MISNQLAVLLSSFAFLGTGAMGLVLVLLWARAHRRHDRALSRMTGFAVLGLGGAYLVAWLGFALVSRDSVLPLKVEKYFCEIDCHLAYRVLEAQRVTGAGTAVGGVRWAIAIQTRFDETTISARRGREAPLWPSPRHVALRDDRGRFHEAAPGAAEWLASTQRTSTPLDRELRPGDSYITTMLFDLPDGASPAALLVEDAGWINHLLIGDELSPGHGKVLLPLPTAAS